jgi:hypothetical protein
MLVYDFALGGDRVPGVIRQIREGFQPLLSSKPAWAPWNDNDTLFSERSTVHSSALKILIGHSNMGWGKRHWVNEI